MQETETCFRRLADSLAQLVWVADREGRICFGNRTWRTRTSMSEGEPFAGAFRAALHPGDRTRWSDVREHALQAGSMYEIESRVRWRADPDYVQQQERGQPIRDADGRIVAWMMVAAAADDDARMIAELHRSLRRRDKFLAIVAHEMRHPLAPIGYALELLARLRNDPAAVIEASGLIARQVKQMRRLIDDLLDLARLEHGQMHVSRNPIDIGAVVAGAIEMAQPIVTARKHVLTVDATPDAVVDGDEGRLTQVVTNLLINAAKYTDEGGRIWLTVERDPPWVLVRVRDTGIGIPGELLPSIFDVYVRAESRAGVAGNGLGVGLTLARELVELHGGSLCAQSEGPGKGSEFVMRLPRRPDDGQRG